MKLAYLLFPLSLPQGFYYQIGEDQEVNLYTRVEVLLKNRKKTALVYEILTPPFSKKIEDLLKKVEPLPILHIIDKEALINKFQITLAQKISAYYFCSLGEALFSILPSAKNGKALPFDLEKNKKIIQLNPKQEKIVADIQENLDQEKKKTFLIHGVTGSGKTEIYKKITKQALEKNQSVIILIPEISLTRQTVASFYQVFGENISLYHSKMTQTEKLGEWIRCQKGFSNIMIGPRGAIFANMKNLGLIIIDEEHETSYKSGQTPRYHATQIAFMRQKIENCTIVLGSATPRIETYFYALQNKITLEILENRYFNSKAPITKIIDLTHFPSHNFLFSEDLVQNMLETLEKHLQILIFVNRRGFSRTIICENCGETFLCPNCDISLSFHKNTHSLVCHHCSYTIDVPLKCPNCGKESLKEVGIGTEKVEEFLKNWFHHAKIARLDSDVTSKKGNLDKILSAMQEHKLDILVGTQMIAKGHDIPHIHLVGILLPDLTLSIPDFRSSEYTFQLLTQVIGRAGRRNLQGKAFIQTFLANHFSILTAAKQDYQKFYNFEIEKRKLFDYPPFCRMVRLVFRFPSKDKQIKMESKLENFISQFPTKDFKIIGPTTCPIEKLHNHYRSHIILKSASIFATKNFILELKKIFDNERSMYIEIDVDPLSFL